MVESLVACPGADLHSTSETPVSESSTCCNYSVLNNTVRCDGGSAESLSSYASVSYLVFGCFLVFCSPHHSMPTYIMYL